MPMLRVHFTGLCLFVRHPGDSQVDVLFITEGTGHHPMTPHLPVMCLPAGVPQTASDDGPHPGRRAGRPEHLYFRDTVDLEFDGAAAAGSVNVVTLDPVPSSPASPAHWRHFGFVMEGQQVFGGASFDLSAANSAAPFGRLQLHGGTLMGAVPTTQLGDHPWVWTDGDGRSIQQTFITNHVVYEAPFFRSVAIVGRRDGIAPDRIELTPPGDCDVWITHDPYDKRRRDQIPTAMEHLALFSPCFVGEPEPVTIAAAPLMSPESGTCSSIQVKMP